ncbi:hypothetical protein GCM10009635_24130 [Actinocatenispora thailandica]
MSSRWPTWIWNDTVWLTEPATASPAATAAPSTYIVSRPAWRSSATWCHCWSAYAEALAIDAVPCAVVISAISRWLAGSPRSQTCGALLPIPPSHRIACLPVLAPYRNQAVQVKSPAPGSCAGSYGTRTKPSEPSSETAEP